jgi:nitrite reductase/ring-hydroxylating ferredoxin subunit
MWWTTLTGKLEQASALDPAVRALGAAVGGVLPQSPFKDALHGRWLGHAVHPLLVTVPIGMWTGAVLLDLTGEEWARRAARRLVGAGVLAVAPTALTGLADWSELGTFDRPKRVGLVHAAANNATTVLYAASWLARRRGDHRRGRDLALAGAAGLAVGGYLGGHLSYSQGVGVNRNADERRQPDDWTDAGPADLPEGGRRRVDLDGQQVLLVRHQGEVHAMGATCSHLGGPLERGDLEDGCVVCPWHQSRFRLADGSVARGPATSPQLPYDVRLVGGRVEVRARR